MMACKAINTLQLFLFFAFIFNCVSTADKWTKHISEENVKEFATFIDEIFEMKKGELQIPLDFCKDRAEEGKEKILQQQRMVFYLSFAEFAVQLADFQMNNDSVGIGEFCKKFKHNTETISYHPHFQNDIKLEQFLEEKYKNLFCTKEKESLLSAESIDQILLLTFSLALRLKFSAIFASYQMLNLDFLKHSNDKGSEYWQIQTLLSAYKQLSDTKGIAKFGIFPFELSKISEDKTFAFWMVNFSDQQKRPIKDFEQYIENFTFIVNISKFSLTSSDVIKIIEAIIDNEGKENGQENEANLPEVYRFVRRYFLNQMKNVKSSKPSAIPPISCILYNLGFQLNSLLSEPTQKFGEFFAKHKRGCGGELHKWISEVVDDTVLDDVYGLGYRIEQIDLELLKEPIKRYAKAIGFKETEKTEKPTEKPTKGKGKQKTDAKKVDQKLKGKKANQKKGQ